MKPLLEILQKNRRLININLSWNNIMRVPENLQPIAIGEGEETKVLEIEQGQDAGDLLFLEHEQEIIQMLGKIIKHSRTI